MDIDIKEVGNMIKQNPKVFGAELINMIVADPYLLFLPLGWGRLGRAVVNSIRMKTGKRLQYKKLAKRAGMSSQKKAKMAMKKKPKMAMKKAKASQTAGAIMKRERMMN